MENIQRSYYAIIPASVRYDKKICANAKLLYGEISALCNEKGFCWANNQYFMELYEVGKNTIIRWINELVEAGYLLKNIQYADDGKTVLQRCLAISNDTRGGVKNDTTPSIKNDTHNNTSNNIYNNPLTPLEGEGSSSDTTPQKKPGVNKENLIAELNESDLTAKIKANILEWLEYKKYKYELSGFKKLLTVIKNQLSALNDAEIIEQIDKSIANGYKGIAWRQISKGSQGAMESNSTKGGYTQLW